MNAARSLDPSPRTLEVESLAGFDRLVAAGARSMHGWHAQSLDLRGRTAALEALDAQGAIFLGCTFDDGVEDWLRRRGALIFPRLQGVPFNPYRGQLYTPQELYAGIATLTLRGHARRTRVPVEHPPGPAAPAGCHPGRRPA